MLQVSSSQLSSVTCNNTELFISIENIVKMLARVALASAYKLLLIKSNP
jgi:hypothetical protein